MPSSTWSGLNAVRAAAAALVAPVSTSIPAAPKLWASATSVVSRSPTATADAGDLEAREQSLGHVTGWACRRRSARAPVQLERRASPRSAGGRRRVSGSTGRDWWRRARSVQVDRAERGRGALRRRTMRSNDTTTTSAAVGSIGDRERPPRAGARRRPPRNEQQRARPGWWPEVERRARRPLSRRPQPSRIPSPVSFAAYSSEVSSGLFVTKTTRAPRRGPGRSRPHRAAGVAR